MAGKTKNQKQTTNKPQTKKSLQDKTTNQKKAKSSSCCPWLFGSFLLFGIIVGLLAYDTHIHGGVFAKSATGNFLKQTGALPYVEIAWTKSMSASARGYKWAEKHVPVYLNQTCTTIKPYTDFGKDVSITGYNFLLNRLEVTREVILEKLPIVANFIEQYAPGLPEKIASLSKATWNFVCSTTSHIYVGGSEFFKTKVFVGNLSPENLGKALNNTQIRAAEYYSWFHKKVDTYAKIK